MEEEKETINVEELQRLISQALNGHRINVLDLVTVFTLTAVSCVKRLNGDKEQYFKALSEIWEEVPVLK